MGKKTFYTASDMEELKGRGVTSLDVGEDDIITDISREAATRLGITLRFKEAGEAPRAPRAAERQSPAAGSSGVRSALIRETSRVLQQDPPRAAASAQSSAPASAPARSSASAPDEYWMHKFRIFLDTADTAQIRDAVSTGLVDGIATNPNKVAQSGKSYRQVVEEIRRFFSGPIAVQALGGNVEEVCASARRLHQMDPLLAVKVTANKYGLAAVKILAAEGVRTNATLMFNPTQALLAGLAGSPFISPFIGRARDTGHDGIEAIRRMRQLLDAFHCDKTNLIAASIKDVEQVIESILAGAHSIAIPFSIFEQMCDHPLTAKGLASFVEEYKTIPQS